MKRLNWLSVGYYAVNIIICALFLVPFLWTLSTSFKLPGQIFVYPPKIIPDSLITTNYATVIGDETFTSYFFNSVIVSVATVICVIGVTSLAGYAFAKIPFPAKNILFILFLVPLMIPFHIVLMPLFILIKNLGLMNTHLALILIYSTFYMPLSIFLMRNTFDTVPSELMDAALIDGCSVWGVFARVMLPLSWVGIVTVSIFTFMYSWNQFLIPLIFTTSENMRTLPVGLSVMQSTYYSGGIRWEILSAGNLISCIPIIIVFLTLQRYFIKGVTGGAIK